MRAAATLSWFLLDATLTQGCVGAERAPASEQAREQRSAAPTNPLRGADTSAGSSGGGALIGAEQHASGSGGARPRRAAAGSVAPAYVGDVPARAATSGSAPCGSSEFSVGPCGGRSGSSTEARAAQAGGAGGQAARTEAQAGSRQLGSAGESAGTGGELGSASIAQSSVHADCRVGPLPESVRERYQLDAFYKQYADARGIPVVASDKPVERTLELACQLVNEMLSERPDVHDALIEDKVTFAIVASSERTTEIPEYRDLPAYYDARARGLGGHTGLCAEENILCDRAHDAWRGESMCVHEYAHTIAIYGLFSVDSSFEDRLTQAFDKAQGADLWRDTLAGQDAQEYWAEGVQDWYDTNLSADPPDGLHGPIHTKDQLEKHDPTLYHLIDELLPEQPRWADCYKQP